MKTAFFLLPVLFVVLFAACGGGTSGGSGHETGSTETIVINVAHDARGIHPYQPGMEKFKEVLEAETNGRVHVNIFPSGQLGNEEQELQGVRLGHIDATVVASGNLAPLVPELDLFNLPFIFRDKNHFFRVLDGPVGQWVGRAIEEKTGCVFLGYWTIGTRITWNSKRPVKTPEDFNGLKIRVMSSPILLDTFNAFGAQATTMSWGELYSALQMGVLDGGESSAVDVLVEKLYEVSHYVSLTNHVIGAAPFFFNKKRYNELPPSVQTAILTAARAAARAARDADEKFAEEAVRQLKELGMEFIDVDKDRFRDMVQPIYEKYAEKLGGMALIDQIAKQ